MKILRSIISILIAGVILVSTTSFTINMHLCGGRVASIALLDKAAACAMEQLQPCQQKLMKHNCCEDKELKIEGKDLSSKIQETIQLQHLQFSWVMNLPVVNKLVFSTVSLTQPSFTYYSPPLLDRDIPVLKQSFLI